ncbi:peroxiredoxin-like family protein [Amycolatopsis palatopharyngis]|uniref:peroxiredoxin-like family protein n=1 Tax=Amycolatopsis palatopharyngis TaxID=187982 RepID=UPI000E27C332|nr:peroxiredoxin-like family protein [Amycolatopsis palatopharyngis]
MNGRVGARLGIGDAVVSRELATIHGDSVRLPDPGSLTHLQFRRFSGCPICNVHLRSVAQRYEEITAAGISELVVFHSDVQTMRQYQAELPFAAVADPRKRLYIEFGVESSFRSILHPRSWLAFGRGVAAARSLRGTIGRDEHLGLPADFLIDPQGRIVARKYGAHAADQWSVDELLTLSAQRFAG